MMSTMAAANERDNHKAIGFLEDRYVVGELLGAGSMGRVYSAFDIVLGIDVAVKMLHPELVSSRENVDRFAAEARIAARMLSRHVVSVLGLAVTRAGIPCIIYERLEGETLGQRIARSGGVSLADTLEIVKQISHALTRAHTIGVIHRDVKPDNIFLTRDSGGRLLVKLFDFGIAEMADSRGSYAHCQLAGTPEYMSPETLLGAQEVGCAADLYALGVVVFECLTGTCPFAGDLGDVIEMLRAGARAPLTERRPDLEGAVEAWMDRALHPDPVWRFSSIKELRDELELATRKATAGAARAVQMAA
ncbi:MAG TPA: serine/threonine-protein kinase [Labilithrix sp.]|nr:serine/threonine-protein kinase [Labilithrix sp.]